MGSQCESRIAELTTRAMSWLFKVSKRVLWPVKRLIAQTTRIESHKEAMKVEEEGVCQEEWHEGEDKQCSSMRRT